MRGPGLHACMQRRQKCYPPRAEGVFKASDTGATRANAFTLR